MEDDHIWRKQLQGLLKGQVVHLFPHWYAVPKENDAGFVFDLHNAADMIEGIGILDIEYGENAFLHIHATVDKSVMTKAAVRELVHRIIANAQEDFCFFLDMSDGVKLIYWFITGGYTHGHEGEFVLEGSAISHISGCSV